MLEKVYQLTKIMLKLTKSMLNIAITAKTFITVLF